METSLPKKGYPLVVNRELKAGVNFPHRAGFQCTHEHPKGEKGVCHNKSMKTALLFVVGTVGVSLALGGCTEKAEVSMKVIRDKVENRFALAAGEEEVANELYMRQYADLKERLVKMKVMKKAFSENMDQLYASGDTRRAKLYGERIAFLDGKIPEAEKTLREFFEIYQTHKNEVRYLKDEAAVYTASSLLSGDLEVTSGYEKRAALIRQIKERLQTRAKRAEALMEVGQFEETFVMK